MVEEVGHIPGEGDERGRAAEDAALRGDRRRREAEVRVDGVVNLQHVAVAVFDRDLVEELRPRPLPPRRGRARRVL